MDTGYEVWFSGALRSDATLSGALAALLRLFPKLDGAQAEGLLTGGPRRLKANLLEQDARRLAAVLSDAGLQVQIKTPAPPADAAPVQQPAATAPRTAAAAFRNPSLSLSLEPKSGTPCPKCGEMAVEDGECRRCGIVLEKFLARQAAERRLEQQGAAGLGSDVTAPPASVPSGYAPTRPIYGDAAPSRPPTQAPSGRHPAAPAYTSPGGGNGGGVRSLMNGVKAVIGVFVLLLVIVSVVLRITGAFAPGAPGDRVPIEGSSTGQAATSGWSRPSTTPKGTPWPSHADYVAGYQRLNTNGYSEVTLDNSHGSADLFIKLYTKAGSRWIASRVVYVPAYRRFTIGNLSAATYDVRVQDMENGAIGKTPPFTLEEVHSADGVQYSTYEITLTPVRDGNLRMQPIPENAF